MSRSRTYTPRATEGGLLRIGWCAVVNRASLGYKVFAGRFPARSWQGGVEGKIHRSLLMAAVSLAVVAGLLIFLRISPKGAYAPSTAPSQTTADLAHGNLSSLLGPPAFPEEIILADLPLVNAHEHLYRVEDFERYLPAAEKMGIVKTLFVASSDFTLLGSGHDPREGNEQNTYTVIECAKRYPNKVIPFATVHPDESDLVSRVKRYLRDGARGIKLYTGHPNFYDRPLDAETLLPLYAFCEQAQVPIVWHVNLGKHAEELSRVLKQFPNLRIIIPHFGVAFYNPFGEAMQRLREILDTYPGVYTDTSFGTREILVAGIDRVSRSPEVFRDFYLRYQDRIVWGTDMVITGHPEKTKEWIESVIRACRDLHEKDVYIFWMSATGTKYALQGVENPYGRQRGLNLPRGVLQKIYSENIERFLAVPIRIPAETEPKEP
jgi:predicted TIM-barrel fold metal-dependent hydrolase